MDEGSVGEQPDATSPEEPEEKAKEDAGVKEKEAEKEPESEKGGSFSFCSPLGFLVLTCILTAFLYSGIIFGWGQITMLLIDDGQYSELCQEGHVTTVANLHTLHRGFRTLASEDSIKACPEQMEKLTYLWLLVVVVLSMGLVPGALVDKFGAPPVLAGCGLILFGSSWLVGANETSHRDLNALAFVGLGGSTFTFYLVCLRVAFLVPAHQTTLLVWLSTFFEASAVIPMGFLFAYEELGLSRRAVFMWYGFSVIPFTIALVSLWTVVNRNNRRKARVEPEQEARGAGDPAGPPEGAAELEMEMGEQDWEEEDEADPKPGPTPAGGTPSMFTSISLGPSTTDAPMEPLSPRGKQSIKREPVNSLHELPFLKQIRTIEFLAVATMGVSCVGKVNSYIGSLRDDLQYLGDDGTLARFFGIALPVGVVVLPVVIYLMKFNNPRTSNGFFFCLLLAISIGVLSSIRSLKLQYVTICLFVFFRVYLFSCLNSLIQALFGRKTNGKMFGSVYLLFGIPGVTSGLMAGYCIENRGGSMAIIHMLFTACAILSLIPSAILRRRESERLARVGL